MGKMDYCQEEKRLAIELAKSFIQNSNVKPINSKIPGTYFHFDETICSFTEIVIGFLKELECLRNKLEEELISNQYSSTP